MNEAYERPGRYGIPGVEFSELDDRGLGPGGVIKAAVDARRLVHGHGPRLGYLALTVRAREAGTESDARELCKSERPRGEGDNEKRGEEDTTPAP